MTDTEIADLENGLAAIMAAVLRLEARLIALAELIRIAAEKAR